MQTVEFLPRVSHRMSLDTRERRVGHACFGRNGFSDYWVRKSVMCFVTIVMLFGSPVIGDNSINVVSTLPRIGYIADPTARVYNDTLYVYSSIDKPRACNGTSKGMDNFCMIGYKVMWTKDMITWRWKNILFQDQVPWARQDCTMWAPEAIKSGNLHYIFFPHGDRIGVATSLLPNGYFMPRDRPIEGARGIDPTVLEHNGRWYLYTSMRERWDFTNQIYVWDLSADFTKASNPRVVGGLRLGYKEGPHVYKRNGFIYMLYSRVVPRKGYQLEVARSNYPTNVFWSAGVAVPTFETENHFSSPTNHGSIVDFNGLSYVFYHKHLNKEGIGFKFRTVLFDRICYADDGRIISATHGINGIQLGNCGSDAVINVQ